MRERTGGREGGGEREGGKGDGEAGLFHCVYH